MKIKKTFSQLISNYRFSKYPWNFNKLLKLKRRKWSRYKFKSLFFKIKKRRRLVRLKFFKSYKLRTKKLFKKYFASNLTERQTKKLFRSNVRYKSTLKKVLKSEYRLDTVIYRLFMLNNIEHSRNLIKFNYFLVNGISTNLTKLFLSSGDLIEINEKKAWGFLYNHLINIISNLKKYYSRLFFKFKYAFVCKKKYKKIKQVGKYKELNIERLKGNSRNERYTKRIPLFSYSGKKKNSVSKKPRFRFLFNKFIKKENQKKHRKIVILSVRVKKLNNVYRSFSSYNTIYKNRFFNKSSFLNLKRNIKKLKIIKLKNFNNISYAGFLNKKKTYNMKSFLRSNKLKQKLNAFKFLKNNDFNRPVENKSEHKLLNLYRRKKRKFYIKTRTKKQKSFMIVKKKKTIFQHKNKLKLVSKRNVLSFLKKKKLTRFLFSNKNFKHKVLTTNFSFKNKFKLQFNLKNKKKTIHIKKRNGSSKSYKFIARNTKKTSNGFAKKINNVINQSNKLSVLKKSLNKLFDKQLKKNKLFRIKKRLKSLNKSIKSLNKVNSMKLKTASLSRLTKIYHKLPLKRIKFNKLKTISNKLINKKVKIVKKIRKISKNLASVKKKSVKAHKSNKFIKIKKTTVRELQKVFNKLNIKKRKVIFFIKLKNTSIKSINKKRKLANFIKLKKFFTKLVDKNTKMKKLRSLQTKYNKLKKEEQKIYKLSNLKIKKMELSKLKKDSRKLDNKKKKIINKLEQNFYLRYFFRIKTRKLLNKFFSIKNGFIYFDKKKPILTNPVILSKNNIKKTSLFFKISNKHDMKINKQKLFFDKKHMKSRKLFWYKKNKVKNKAKIRNKRRLFANARLSFKAKSKKKLKKNRHGMYFSNRARLHTKKFFGNPEMEYFYDGLSFKATKYLKKELRELRKSQWKKSRFYNKRKDYSINKSNKVFNFDKLTKLKTINKKKSFIYKKNNKFLFSNNSNILKIKNIKSSLNGRKTVIVYNNLYYSKIKQKIKFLSFFNLFFKLKPKRNFKRIKNLFHKKEKASKLNTNNKLFSLWNKFLIKRKKRKLKFWVRYINRSFFWQNLRVTKKRIFMVKYLKRFNNNYKNFAHYDNLKNIIWNKKNNVFVKKNKLFEKKYKKLLNYSSLKSLIFLKKPKNIKSVFNCLKKNSNFNFNILKNYFKNDVDLKNLNVNFMYQKNNEINRRFLRVKRKYLLLKGFYRKYKNYKVEFLYNKNEKEYKNIQINYKKLNLTYKQRPFNYYYTEFNLKTLEFTVIGDVDFLSFQYKTFLDFKTISFIYSEQC